MDGSEQIKVFHDDDQGYEACIDRLGGYVLTERSGSPPYMLHDSECIHLSRDGDVTLQLTRTPKRWAKSRRPLSDWVRAETGQAPQLCRTCM